MPDNIKVVASVLGGILLFVLFWLLSPFTVIGAGDIGVVSFLGKVSDEPLHPGFHWVTPFSTITTMTTRILRFDDKYDAASTDQQNVHVSMVINSSIDPRKAAEIFKTVGTDIHEKIVVPAANEVLKAEIALHTASDILKNRPRIKTAVQEGMTKWLGKYGVVLNELSISNVRFDERYEKAIEEKQVKEQVALQQTYELQRAQKEAEIAAARAKGEAEAKVNAARGDAEALKLKGDAEAQYNKVVAESLTANLIQAQWITKWSGVLPQFTTSGNNGVMFSVPIMDNHPK